MCLGERAVQEKNVNGYMGQAGSRKKSTRKRKKCKTCRYRGDQIKNGCDYIWITGKRRPCSVEDCTVYEKGAMKRAGLDRLI